MGKRNRQRRAAKARRRAQYQHGGGHHREPLWGFGRGARGSRTLEETVAVLAAAAQARERGASDDAELLVSTLADWDRELLVDVAAAQLLRMLPALWDSGWQPAELVHQGRRASNRVARIMTATILADHAGRDRRTLHDRWAAQVDAMAAGASAAQVASGRPDWLAEHIRREGLEGRDLAVALVDSAATVFDLGPLPVVVPPPGSSAAAEPSRVRAGPGAADDRVLARVRALLAKAESTTYEAEAMAFTAKAQELMARHAIDAAMVWERSGRDEQPATTRLLIDDPYVEPKCLLLHVVAEHSHCRAIVHDTYALCSLVGFASDVAAVEVLFTSLLVQAQVALQAEAAAAAPGSRLRSRSFRSSFLVAYAHRIGERLAEVNDVVQAAAATTAEHGSPGARAAGGLLPVLAARAEAVDQTVEDVFGTLRTGTIRGGDDPVGWARGRAAADRARLTRGELDESS